MLEVQDVMKNVQGYATIPISSLDGNHVSVFCIHGVLDVDSWFKPLTIQYYLNHCRVTGLSGGQFTRVIMNVLARSYSPLLPRLQVMT